MLSYVPWVFQNQAGKSYSTEGRKQKHQPKTHQQQQQHGELSMGGGVGGITPNLG